MAGTSGTLASVSRAPVSITSVVVTSLDESIKYVNATHYTLTSTGSARKIAPLTATIANQTVVMSFDYIDASATVMKVGYKLTLQTVDLKFTHKMSDGKFITIEIPKATVNAGIEIPFSDQEYSTHNITFAALGDMTKPAGESLFKIIREA